MTKKTIKKPYIEFCGNSAIDVTGSCYHVKFQEDSILLDFGLIQTNNLVQDYKENHTKPKGVRPKEISLILISHSNIDHIGRIPWLYKQGCEAPIYCTYGNKDMMRLLLEDSMKIMQSDAEKIHNKHGLNTSSLYDMEDIIKTLDHVIEVDYQQNIVFNNNVSFKFYEAGHIVHSAQIMLTLTDGNWRKIIGYTGDIGSPNLPHYYLDNITPLPYCDYIIGEATYSAKTRNHKAKDRDVDINKIKAVIQEAVDKKTRVLIPVFAFDRLETILTLLYEIYNGRSPLPILVDTPLGQKIAKTWCADGTDMGRDILWDTVRNWSDVTWIGDYADSRLKQDSGLPYIILASSGMCTAGRSLAWLKSMLPVANNKVMFCGYSGEGTLADDIKKGDKKYLIVDGESVKNNAGVVVLNSFSSHMCHNELLDYYTSINYERIYLVHSNQETKIEFAHELKEKLGKVGRTSRVVVTNKDTKVYL